MIIKPDVKRDLPIAVPDQDITAAGKTPADNADLIKFGRPASEIKISLLDKDGETTVFANMEIEIWGYPTVNHPPALVLKADKIPGYKGRSDLPVENSVAYQYLYVLQTSDVNAIGVTGTDNPAGQYQFRFSV